MEEGAVDGEQMVVTDQYTSAEEGGNECSYAHIALQFNFDANPNLGQDGPSKWVIL